MYFTEASGMDSNDTDVKSVIMNVRMEIRPISSFVRSLAAKT
jgi:hypothetical protein